MICYIQYIFINEENNIYIPRASFGLAAIVTNLVNLLLSLVPLVIVMLVSGVTIKSTVIFLPVSIIILACYTLGFGLILSTVAIYFPDLTEMFRIVLTAWLYLTPVIYPENIFPERYYSFLNLIPCII